MGGLVRICTSPILAKNCGRDLRFRSCLSAAANPVSATVWLPGLVKGRPRLKALRLPLAASSLSAQQEVAALTEDSSVQPENELETVHVRFKLQKACLFGQHFSLTGEHPILGSWDPENAIPMNWSEGHIWTTELDIPVGKTILFKFILKNTRGDVEWQPGADRVLHTWKTTNTIVIWEDWENAELQNITEEETVPDQTYKGTLDSAEELGFNFTEMAGGKNGITATPNKKGISFKEEESPITMETDPCLVPGVVTASLSSNGEFSPEKVTYATSCTSFATDDATEGNSIKLFEKQEFEHSHDNACEPQHQGPAMDNLPGNIIQQGGRTLHPLILNFGFFRKQLS